MNLVLAVLVLTLYTVSTTAAERALLVQKITFQDDKSEFYLCRIENGTGINHIKLRRRPPDTKSCEFNVTDNSDGTYSFGADNGRYLGRVTQNGTDFIEALQDSIDLSSKFVVHVYQKRLLLQCDNGYFWSHKAGGEVIIVKPDYAKFTAAQIQLADLNYQRIHP